MKIEKLKTDNLSVLTELFDYNDVEDMISKCTCEIQSGRIDIFVLYDNGILIGELRARYESDDESYAVRGRRAYLFAFRVREGFQNRGYGTYLLQEVIAELQRGGYSEFTVGVEDDNQRAIHMYRAMGFDELVKRSTEEYQGDAYEYNLYLKRYCSPKSVKK